MAAPMDTDPPQQQAPNFPALKVWVMSMNRHVSTDEIVRGLNKIEDEDVRKACLNKPTRDECISKSSLYTYTLSHTLYPLSSFPRICPPHAALAFPSPLLSNQGPLGADLVWRSS
ncbi:hypothetical protein FS842_004635 [Serendipita sp. 407]|nr:hypothetical protein FS842_004635 [Serendipita sp. 407]